MKASEWHFIDNYNNVIFTFSQFSSFVYPKRLTNDDNGSNQHQQKSNDVQVLQQVSVSLTYYKKHIF